MTLVITNLPNKHPNCLFPPFSRPQVHRDVICPLTQNWDVPLMKISPVSPDCPSDCPPLLCFFVWSTCTTLTPTLPHSVKIPAWVGLQSVNTVNNYASRPKLAAELPPSPVPTSFSPSISLFIHSHLCSASLCQWLKQNVNFDWRFSKPWHFLFMFICTAGSPTQRR